MKIGIITQARTTSYRLPLKILLKANEETLLETHLKRLKLTKYPVFVATTLNAADDIIVKICHEHNFQFYRGSESDVLARFYECATLYQLDIIVRATSDCPLIDTDSITNGVKAYIAAVGQFNKHDLLYMSNTIVRTFPKGMDFEIFSYKMLEMAHQNATTKSEREHVTPYFYEGKEKEIKLIDILNQKNTSNLRITLDYLEDYSLIKTLIEKYNALNLPLEDIEKLLQNNNELQDLIAKCKTAALQLS